MLLLLAALALLAACGGSSVVGKYTSEKDPDRYRELRTDGTFYSQEGAMGSTGLMVMKSNILSVSASPKKVE